MSRCGVRGLFYTLARLLGDVSAIHKGSRAIVRRLERRGAGRVTGRMLGKMFRGNPESKRRLRENQPGLEPCRRAGHPQAQGRLDWYGSPGKRRHDAGQTRA